MTTILRLLIAITLSVVLVGCAPGGPDFEVTAEEVDGLSTLGLSLADKPVSGIIVYFHGMDQNAEVTRMDDKHTALTEDLLRAGYAVVSADAEGNAFGNPASQQAYRDLIAAARARYASDRVIFVAESMGALPALLLWSTLPPGEVRAMVGITPAMGMPVGVRSMDFVVAPWGGQVPESADPMSWPAEALTGDRIRLYVGDQDDVIPPGATGQDFAERFGGAADVEVVPCHGGHVADTCFDGTDLVNWLSGIG
ncbi:alpha/beta hydrolase [Mycolicibacterium bacteremicum]|uniref:Serine aminopeptidase S33 domain-containing protein n=1 Tax=Mycolicibacterium bacteremicum TaxID=564198 RepID=A0A1W9Z3Q6_MYCBA|nr:alpha/beta hydrolase [Mycolicibacterium bacteremicum]MCV7431875.1 alpha/beta hydrolase [Mycolicibacterium bacteremicum]ORA06670.1 hypothetical protein BST17_03225 [Mycolicibacterium bacteremicum]